MARYKRRISLIKPRFQLKLVSIFLCLATSCILLQFALLHVALTDLASAASDNAHFADEVSNVLWRHLFITLGLLVPLTLLVGILVTFRIAGPVYRMEQHLEAIARGDNPGPCRVRDGDEFQNLCDVMNQAVSWLGGYTSDPEVEKDKADKAENSEESEKSEKSEKAEKAGESGNADESVESEPESTPAS